MPRGSWNPSKNVARQEGQTVTVAIQDNGIEAAAVSAFAQNRLHLGAWEVTPGLRFEHVRATNENRMMDARERDDYSRWLPGVGAAVQLPRGVTILGGAPGVCTPTPPGTSQIWGWESALRPEWSCASRGIMWECSSAMI